MPALIRIGTGRLERSFAMILLLSPINVYCIKVNGLPFNNYNAMSAYHQDVAVSVDSASFRSRLASKQVTQRYEDFSLASEEN